MPESRIIRSESMADMMAKLPVNKSSLLTSIETLLKTIESSESSVMIPTLLRDKCEFDAWELLFVAKILKASILGHTDLVEFYMNHISQQKKLAAELQATSGPSTPTATAVRQPSSLSLSPAISNQQQQQQQSNGCGQNGSLATGLPSSASSVSSQTSTATSTATSSTSPSNSSATWMTATSQQQQQQSQQNNDRSTSSSFSSSSGSSSASSSSAATTTTTATATTATTATTNGAHREADIELAVLARTLSTPSMGSFVASSPGAQRPAQPPSLLQLTTTNNHIISNGASRLTASGAIEQLASSTMQLLSSAPTLANTNTNGFGATEQASSGSGALSISTTTAGQQQQQQAGTPTTPPGAAAIVHHELRSSRSAGCLFRNQSGASSPRTPLNSTPTTPCQAQAETLANGGSQLAGDASMPVKLLLQIEQLKSSIVYVTNLLDNVVELYKKSIDNIA